jgi:hypothetical protein
MDDPAQRSHSETRLETARRAFSPRGKPPVPDGTPAQIKRDIVWEAREPLPLARQSAPAPARPAPDPSKHRLVVLGDSLTQGFKSFAIRDTKLSWPKIVADHGGLAGFRYPWFDGPESCAGMPLNLEAIVKDVYWPDTILDIREDARLFDDFRRLMDDVEDYWERGDGAQAVNYVDGAAQVGRKLDGVNHNLAVWGMDIRDALSLDISRLRKRITSSPNRGDQSLNQFVSAAYERSAMITLKGGGNRDTPVSLAQALGEEKGIETLIVALGANNILGTVIDFQIHWTDEHDYADVDRTAKPRYNAWTPEHFRKEFDALLAEVKKIKADNVIVFTVPHVTIVPMVRGVGTKMPGDRYFARYTRPWIPDHLFNANRHDCLTGDELRVLDFAVDQYNDHICAQVGQLDQPKGQRWKVLDVAGVLDRLAYRRYLIDDEARPTWWEPYDLPDAFRELSPIPDTRFFGSDRFGRTQGGLFSLDGIHPTTLGYSIVAREVMQLMTELGVPLKAAEPDYDKIIAADSMITDPPQRLASVLPVVALGHRIVNLLETVNARPEIM